MALGERDLSCTLMVRNTGSERFAFSAALRTHIGVDDASSEKVVLLGLMGSPFFDCGGERPQPVVGVEHEPLRRLDGPTDLLYVSTQPRVALEVGTGCTVFVENTQGFTDHSIWNPWEAVPSYPNFVCVQPAVAAAPVKLPPACAPGHSTAPAPHPPLLCSTAFAQHDASAVWCGRKITACCGDAGRGVGGHLHLFHQGRAAERQSGAAVCSAAVAHPHPQPREVPVQELSG